MSSPSRADSYPFDGTGHDSEVPGHRAWEPGLAHCDRRPPPMVGPAFRALVLQSGSCSCCGTGGTVGENVRQTAPNDLQRHAVQLGVGRSRLWRFSARVSPQRACCRQAVVRGSNIAMGLGAATPVSGLAGSSAGACRGRVGLGVSCATLMPAPVTRRVAELERDEALRAARAWQRAQALASLRDFERSRHVVGWPELEQSLEDALALARARRVPRRPRAQRGQR